MNGQTPRGTREKDTTRPDDGELCAFSDKYGPHIPAPAVVIGRDEHGNRRIACVPTCPKPATDQNGAAA
jgi:hypothetical protein